MNSETGNSGDSGMDLDNTSIPTLMIDEGEF